jgi:hypothetical protein
MRKLLIQEKGEEDYKYLFNKKLRAIQEQIDDRITKDNLHYKLEYYNNDQANKLYREQYEERLKMKREKSKQRKKIKGYKLGCTAGQIKERILRFMSTFNKNYD